MKFIVNIGDSKAGSSAIQYALSQEIPALKGRGIICDDVQYGHFCLPRLIGETNRGDPAASLKIAQRALQRLQKSCEGAPDSTVLLSAESFMPLSPAQVITIIKFIAVDISDLVVVAYLRPPDEHYLSFTQQEMKGNVHFPKPDQYDRHIDEAMAGWIAEPRCRKVIVRPFIRDQLRNDSVVQDFSHILQDVTGVDPNLEDNFRNTTLSAEQMVVLQRFRTYSGFTDDKLHPVSKGLVAFFDDINSKKLIGVKPKLSPDARDAVIVKNSKSIARLNSMFPDLNLPQAEVLKPVKEPRWTNDPSVGSILEKVSERDVALLHALIPFQPDGTRQDITFRQIDAVQALSERHDYDKDLLLGAYFKYLASTPNFVEMDLPDNKLQKLEAKLEKAGAKLQKAEARAKEVGAKLKEAKEALRKAWRNPIRHLFLAYRKKARRSIDKRLNSQS